MVQFFKNSLVLGLLLWLNVGVQVEAKDLHAYALRYGLKELLGYTYNVTYLDQIDLQTDSVVRSFPFNAGYNSVTILDDKNLILCDTEDSVLPKGADLFNLAKKAVVKSFKIAGVCPKVAFPAGDKIFIVTTKNTQNQHQELAPFKVWPSIEIFDRHTFEKIKDIDLREGENVGERCSLSQNNSKLYFIGWNSIPSLEGSGLVGKIDVNSGNLEKEIDYGSLFGGGRWIAAGPPNKIYISAVYPDPMEGKKPEDEAKLNDKLFVLDANGLSLIKTIPISIIAEQLVYVPVVNQLYIAHSSMSEKTPPYIEVLDCKKDQVVAKIPMQGFRMMQYVGNHKLYVSSSGGTLPMFSKTIDGPGIFVVDVRTNKILKKIPGEYAPISYNFDPVDDIISKETKP